MRIDESIVFGGVWEKTMPKLSKEELVAMRLSGRVAVGSIYFCESTEDGFKRIVTNDAVQNSMQEL